MTDAAPPSPAPATAPWTRITLLAGLWLASATGVEALTHHPEWGRAAVLVDDGTRAVLAWAAFQGLSARARLAPRAFGPFLRAFAWAMAILGATTVYLIVTHDLLRLPAPIPTLRHGGYMAATCVLALGLLRLPVVSLLATHRLQAFLDGLLISASIFFIAWATCLHRLVAEHGATGSLYALTLVHPFLSTALGAIWVVQEHRIHDGRLGLPGSFVRWGLAILVAWWPLYAVGNIQGWYRTLGPSERMDAFFGLGLLCFAFAGLWPLRPQVEEAPSRNRRHATLLPYALAAVAMGFAAWLYVSGHPYDPVMVATGALMALVLTFRQFLAVRDLNALSRTLETRVAERTAELAHSQQELLRSQRARLVAAMAAGFSHDFKNLLGIIRNWAERLSEEATTPDQERGLRTIQDATDRALGLVQDILAAGRVQDLAPRTFDLGDFLRERSGRLEGMLGGRGRLALDLEAGELPVHMDPDKLDLALANLASNAADAMASRGTLTLRARRDPVEAFSILEVADDGSGIPAGDLERIFEPFFTTKAIGKGTGLGLSSVQGTVLQSGGTMTVRSVVGAGTVFTLRLPQVPA
ncbi:sensor histidine kinase [Mesoterricola sediminis]|uniref:histidine kinase n=1 Tax=Mesoterricola sediminis TaxID=2927980 RepID=A0AA48H240_9BACT|nr:HAMP domain-containing sensor histidine kinase [Mesoterricola sediminis]BDU76066.1 hypothetical protein METESE_10240 [Mesoterricola sediminis]